MSGNERVERGVGVGPVVELETRRDGPFLGRSSPDPGWSRADQLLWTISLAIVFVLGFAGGARVASRSHEPSSATACVTPAPAAPASGHDPARSAPEPR